jgi:hypothetical protein
MKAQIEMTIVSNCLHSCTSHKATESIKKELELIVVWPSAVSAIVPEQGPANSDATENVADSMGPHCSVAVLNIQHL